MVVFLRGDGWVGKEGGVKRGKKFVKSQIITDPHTMNFSGCNSYSEKPQINWNFF